MAFICLLVICGCADRPADQIYGLYIESDSAAEERDIPFLIRDHLLANIDDDSLKISLIPGSRTPEGLPRGRISTNCFFSNFMPNPEILNYKEQYSLSFYFTSPCGENQMREILNEISSLEGIQLNKLYQRP